MAAAPQIRLFTARDGYRYAARVWPHPEPLASVVCLHGIVSHGGWYHSSGAHLAAAGFAVHFLDRRGAGLNPVDRGDVPHWETWLTDVERYLEALPSQWPRILMGISWGGTLAAAVAQHRPSHLDGLGLLCPGLFSRKAPHALQRAALWLAATAGLQRLRVTIPLQDPALFTDSPAHQSYIAQDPLALRKLTIRAARANLKLTRYAADHPEAIRVPTLAMLAGRDPITDNQRVRQFVERISHSDKQVIEYPGALHTLEFEPDPGPYLQDLAAWCRHLGRPSRRTA